MKIKSEQFRKYARLLNNVCIRGNRVTESFYMDLKNSCIYFQQSNFMGRMPFELERVEGEVIKNFFVNIPVFMALCNEYEEIELTEKVVEGVNSESGEYDKKDDLIFSNGEEEFMIPFFRDARETENFDAEKFDYTDRELWSDSSLSDDFMNELKLSSFYVGENDFTFRNLSGVAILPDSIVSTNGSRIFQSKIESPFAATLPNYAVKLITTGAAMSVPVNLCRSKTTDTLMVVYGHGEYVLIIPETTDLYTPNLKDEELLAVIKHDTSITMGREDILGVLQFFEPLVKDVVNQMLLLNIKDKETLSVESREGTVGNRNIHLTECSEELIGGGELWVARQDLVLGLTSILDENIKMEISFSEDSKAYNIEGVENKSRLIILVKLQ